VTPSVRDRTAQENGVAAQRRDPNGGPYGPDTCKQGYVWREAFDGDHVCVTPEIRTEAAADNATAESRKAANTSVSGGSNSGGKASASGYRVELPLNTPFRSDTVTYTIQSATAAPDIDGSIRINLEIKASNEGRYDLNFWDSTFRLRVGGETYAPVSGLNELVAGSSTKTGTVSFVVPDSTPSAELAILFQSGERTVPVTISVA
jgi:hypothetical protein